VWYWDAGQGKGVVLGASPHPVCYLMSEIVILIFSYRVWTAVLVQSVSKNSCWVTTADDPTEFELDTSECPFLPVNPRTVDDMTSLLYLHEAAILENLCERSKPQYLRPYTYVSNVLIAVNPLRKIEIPSMEVRHIF
jgi:myosin heavy subunit